jgi:hypothetical protein
MTGCRATKRDGSPCKGTARGADGYCWAHAPEHAEQRSRNASKAARTKPSREIGDLKLRISVVVAGVLDGTLDRGRAAVAIQGFNSLRGVLELERRVRELDQLEARLAELEQAGGNAKEKRWAT